MFPIVLVPNFHAETIPRTNVPFQLAILTIENALQGDEYARTAYYAVSCNLDFRISG